MKQTSRIALGGMMGALTLLCLMLTLFPYATYALPALAGIFLIPVVVECGKRFAATLYAATAILSLLITPDLEAKWLYVCFFGYYPIIKAVAETRHSRVVEWGIKIGTFNIAVVAAYVIVCQLGFSLGEFAVAGVSLPLSAILGLFLFAGNVVFVLYDVALTRALPLYFSRFQPLLQRLLK